MSLKKKTITGLYWSIISQGGKQASQFIITAILARFLSPSDFGLLAMVTVFMNFVMIFSEMGMSSALIQKQNTHDRHFYSAFWLNIFVGICLTFLFIIISPVIVRFYNKPMLLPLLIVLSANFFISSFVIIQQTILTKTMDFKKLAIRDLWAVLFSGGVAIYLACHGYGIWSLVWQVISFSVANVFLLWTVSSWRPKFVFAIEDIKDIFAFSANLTGFNIVNYFARNIDQLLIGRFLGAQSLGYYSLAYKIMLYPLQNVSVVVGRVLFPAFSSIQNNLEKIRDAYLKIVKGISLITFPLMLFLCVIASDFVHIILGSAWSPVVNLLQILSVCGLIQSINTTVGNVILSQGRADIQLKLGVLGAFFVSIAVFWGMRWGIFGVALVYTIEQFLWSIFVQLIANRLIKLELQNFLFQLKHSAIVSIVIAGVLFLLKQTVPIVNDYRIGIYLLASMICYILSMIFLKEVVLLRKRPYFRLN